MISIAFEGLEYSGKSTAVRRFYDLLSKEDDTLSKPNGLAVKVHSNTSDTYLGTAVLDLMRSKNGGYSGDSFIDGKDILKVIMTERLLNLKYINKPFMDKNGGIIIYDRYLDTTLFLQGVMSSTCCPHEVLQIAGNIDPVLREHADIVLFLMPTLEEFKRRLSLRSGVDKNQRDVDFENNIEHHYETFKDYVNKRHIEGLFSDVFNPAPKMTIVIDKTDNKDIDSIATIVKSIILNSLSSNTKYSKANILLSIYQSLLEKTVDVKLNKLGAN